MTDQAAAFAASYDVQEMLALVPGAADAMRPDGTLDPAGWMDAGERLFTDYLARLEALGNKTAALQNPTLDELLAIDREVAETEALPVRLFTFMDVMPRLLKAEDYAVLPSQSEWWQMRMREQAQPLMIRAGEPLVAALEAFGATYPEHRERLAVLYGEAGGMAQRPEAPVTTDLTLLGNAFETLYARAMSPEDDTRAEALGPAFNTVLQHYMAKTRANQGASPVTAFARQYDLADELAGIRRYMDSFEGVSAVMGLPNAVGGMDEPGRFTWEEAKAVVIHTFRSIHPEMAAVAERAFEENWVWAHGMAHMTPATMAGLAAKDGGHPYLAMPFNGSASDVSTLAHEMAHVVAATIAGERFPTHMMDAPAPLHESFALFAELRVAAELGREMPELSLMMRKHAMQVMGSKTRLLLSAHTEAALYDRAEGNPDLSYEDFMAVLDAAPFGPQGERGLSRLLLQVEQFSPMRRFAYPLAALVADGMAQAYEHDPGRLGDAMMAVMRQGGLVPFREGVETLLGRPQGLSAETFAAAIGRWQETIAVLRAETAALDQAPQHNAPPAEKPRWRRVLEQRKPDSAPVSQPARVEAVIAQRAALPQGASGYAARHADGTRDGGDITR